MMALDQIQINVGAHEYLGELYLMKNQKDKAISILSDLEKLVGKDAKEYIDLLSAIEKFKS